jgi:hypothetical protein
MEKFRAYWEKAQQLFPNWPGFSPRRRDSQWQQFYTEAGERADRQWEEIDERFRASQSRAKESEKLPAK